MFFQSVSAEVDEVTCSKNATGQIIVKAGGIGATQFANEKLGLLTETTAAGTESYVDFTSLDSSACKGYLLVVTGSVDVVGGSALQLMCNGDNTTTNYTSGTQAGGGANTATFIDNNNEDFQAVMWIQREPVNGKFTATGTRMQRADAQCGVSCVRSDADLGAAITSLRVAISGGGGTFESGTLFQLYELQEQ